MGGKGDAVWREFFDLMMSSYKMELKPPKEYSRKEMRNFKSPLLIIASDNDIFFPAERVFTKAKKIFNCPITTFKIKATPHRTCAEDAPTNFSSDCIEIPQAY